MPKSAELDGKEAGWPRQRMSIALLMPSQESFRQRVRALDVKTDEGRRGASVTNGVMARLNTSGLPLSTYKMSALSPCGRPSHFGALPAFLCT